MPTEAHSGFLRFVAASVLIAVMGAAMGPVALAQADSGGAMRTQLAEDPDPRDDQPPKPDSEEAKPRLEPNIAPADAARQASREYGGRVLNVVLEDGPGGPYYRVKLLDGGRVRVVHVEARH